MKKIGYGLFALGMLLALYLPFYYAEKDVAWETMEQFAEALHKERHYEPGNASFIRKYYGLPSSSYDKALVYRHPSAMEAEEFAVFYSTDTKQQDVLIKKLKERKQKKYDSFAGYGQAQCELIEEGEVFQKGSYTFLIVEQKNMQLKQRVEALFS